MKFNYKLYPGRTLKKQEYEENNQKPIISIITTYYNDYRYIEPSPVSGIQPATTLGCFDKDKVQCRGCRDVRNRKSYSRLGFAMRLCIHVSG